MEDGQKNIFTKVIETNEQIKQLEKYTFSVRIRALNAHILAIKTGQSASGFRVVAKQIIEFSNELDASCSDLQRLYRSVLSRGSYIIKREKTRIIFQRANQHAEAMNVPVENQQAVKKTLQKISADLDIMYKDVTKDIVNLSKYVEQALRVTYFGQGVALQTKIECAHITVAKSAFQHAASGFNESMDNIERLLNLILKKW